MTKKQQDIYPPGLYPVTYETKNGPVKKFRVKITRKHLKIDKLFDTYEDAKEVILASKTARGKEALLEAVATDKARRELSANSKNTLGWHLRDYYERYLKRLGDDQKSKFNNETNEAIIRSICRTEISISNGEVPMGDGTTINLGVDFKRIDSLSLLDLSPAVIEAYFNKRLDEGLKASTIRRHMNLLSACLNRLGALSDNSTLKALALNNPVRVFLAGVKGLRRFKPKKTKEQRRLGPEEENRLYEVLKRMRNPAMIQIVGLSHYTGMRRSEILDLTWKQVKHAYRSDDPKQFYIQLTDTKNEEFRKVKLFPEAVEIINALEPRKDDEPLFPYTYAGFNSNIKRALKKAEITGFTFHGFRGEFISRQLDMSVNSIVAGRLAGAKDIGYFDRTHKKRWEESQRLAADNLSEGQVLDQVGHKSKQVTHKHYYKPSE